MATALESQASTLAPEVLALAQEKGVDQLIAPIINMTKRIFTDLRRFEIKVEEDWEIDGLRLIVVEVTVPSLEGVVPTETWCEELTKKRQTWSRELVNLCPAPLLLTFCLGVEVED